MEENEFQQKTIKAIAELQKATVRITNYNQCLQALCLALAEQDGLNLQKLEADYEDNLQRAQEQMPPHLQAPDVYASFFQALQDRLQRPRG